MTRAVEEDTKQNYRQAYYAYCEGLQYFVPLIAAETDEEKQLLLQNQVTTYMERAEEIRRSFIETAVQSIDEPIVNDQRDEAGSSKKNPAKQTSKPASNFKQLCKRDICNRDSIKLIRFFLDSQFASTPQIQHALEIGRQAELYSYEKSHTTALDLYTSALNILVPLLPLEPSGSRKDLLQKQVMEWMQEAESLKALIMTHNATDTKSQSQQCCIN